MNHFIWGGGGYPFVSGAFNINIADGGGSFKAVGGGGSDSLEFHYSDGSVAKIAFDGLKNPSPAYFDGFGNFLDQVTGKSHGGQFYLQRRSMAAAGTITRPGSQPVPVVGVGWYDRQWGSVIGTPGTQADNVYWKWFSIHLSDDTEYHVWDMYAVDTGNSLIRVVNKIGAAPACEESTFTNVTVTGLGSPVFDPGPPPSTLELANHISIPDEKLELDVREATPNQIVESGGLFSPFIEGAMKAIGTKNGHPVVGTGYYEQFVPPGGCCQGT
jgi:predicted secreted hydrolase